MLVQAGKYGTYDKLKEVTCTITEHYPEKPNNAKFSVLNKQNYHGSVTSYDSRPGNETGKPTWGPKFGASRSLEALINRLLLSYAYSINQSINQNIHRAKFLPVSADHCLHLSFLRVMFLAAICVYVAFSF